MALVGSLEVALGLKVRNYLKGIDDAARATQQMEQDVENLNRDLGTTGRELDDVGRDATAAGKDIEGASKKLGGLQKAALVAGGAAITFGRQWAYAAADLEESINLTGLIFEENAGKIDEWVKGSAEGIGQAEAAAREGAGQIGGLLKNMGLTIDETTEFSTKLVTLAADMGSAFNMEPARAVYAIGAALRGETEPIRAFNVMLDEAAVKQKALEMGLYDGTGALDNYAKAQARVALIVEQTNDIQGDFQNTADGLANATRIMSAQFQDLQAQLGQRFVPLVSKLVETTVNLIEGFGALDDALGGSLSQVMVYGGAIAALGVGVMKVSGPIGNMGTKITAATAGLSGGARAAAGFRAAMSGGVGPTLAITAAITAATIVINKMGDAKRAAAERAKELEGALGSLSGGLRSNVVSAIMGTDVYEKAADELEFLGVEVSDLLPLLQSGTDAFQDLGDQAEDMAKFTRGSNNGLSDLQVALRGLTTSYEGTEGPAADFFRSLERQYEAGELTAGQLQDIFNFLDETADSFDDAGEGADNHTRVINRLTEAYRIVGDELGYLDRETVRYQQTTRGLSGDIDALESVTVDLMIAERRLNDQRLRNVQAQFSVIRYQIEQREDARKLADALADLAEAQIAVEDAFTSGTEVGDDFISVLEDIASNKFAEAIEKNLGDPEAFARSSVRGLLEMAGVAEEVQEEILALIGLFDEPIEVKVAPILVGGIAQPGIPGVQLDPEGLLPRGATTQIQAVDRVIADQLTTLSIDSATFNVQNMVTSGGGRGGGGGGTGWNFTIPPGGDPMDVPI